MQAWLRRSPLDEDLELADGDGAVAVDVLGLEGYEAHRSSAPTRAGLVCDDPPRTGEGVTGAQRARVVPGGRADHDATHVEAECRHEGALVTVVTGNNDMRGGREHVAVPAGLCFARVRVHGIGSAGCTGELISANQVLTAAHCVSNAAGTVSFVDPSNALEAISIASMLVDPLYDGNGADGSDLAILTLATNAPSYSTIYSIYSGAYSFGTAVTVAGFGLTGTGDTGGTTYDQKLRVGENVYDTTGATVGFSSSLWLADFDTGKSANNVLGGTDTAITNEVDVAHGDSGGPTFYNGQLIGVHDLIVCYTDTSGNCITPPSVNTANNSYYGEVFADSNVTSGANLAFIDAQLAPEPSTSALLGLGTAGLLWFRIRRKDGRKDSQSDD